MAPQPSSIHVTPIDKNGQSFVNLCQGPQPFWVKKVVINSLDHEHPSHQDSSAARLFISNLITLTPANHKPAPPLTMKAESKINIEGEREQRKRDGRQADHTLQLSSILTSATQQKR